jgi:hypothetical protein
LFGDGADRLENCFSITVRLADAEEAFGSRSWTICRGSAVTESAFRSLFISFSTLAFSWAFHDAQGCGAFATSTLGAERARPRAGFPAEASDADEAPSQDPPRTEGVFMLSTL